MSKACLALIAAAALMAGCSSGGGGSQSSFALIEFLDSGKDEIPRNRVLTFQFSAPVEPGQNLPERLKIQNVQTGQQSDFSSAIGLYFVSGEVVVFQPRLPERDDRSDSGFRENGNYRVFVKGGGDSLTSTAGDTIAVQQEFLFDTNDTFEDPDPTQPPRALALVARDVSTGNTFDISRLDARPDALAKLDSNALLSATDAGGLPTPRALEPGAGGAPNFATPWQFELHLSEPIDPSTVSTDNIELFEIRNDALDGPTSADPGTIGDPVNHRVPINVQVVQQHDPATGALVVFIRVSPTQTLVDDARYRLVFSGNILGIDFKKQFIGENGLTGDALTISEPGGIGYVTEFLVFDRPAITATRTLTYDPTEDGINPETGATTLDPDLLNGAQYNSPLAPGTALGVIGSFGSSDQDLAVSGANTSTLDTGDEANNALGNPFTTDGGFAPGRDLDVDDTYKNTAGVPPSGFRTFDNIEPTVFEFGSVSVSSSATLQIVGVNPCQILCNGLVQINGTLDASGGDGGQGFASASVGPAASVAPGVAGTPGPGGWSGGQGDSTQSALNTTTVGCASFEAYLAGPSVNQGVYPSSKKGEGPGRGNQGGEGYQMTQATSHSDLTGSGGGGGSYAVQGERGEDRFQNTTTVGSPGRCGRWGATNSSVIGVRGMPGPTYGDRELLKIRAGGSGGGSGGGMHGWRTSGGGMASGGGGGGGGGFLEVIAGGAIVVAGGRVSVAGGDGGKGAFQSLRNGSWTRVAGSGGGGSGGALSLISTTNIDLTGAVIDARGGSGGPRPDFLPSISNCNSCNAGGDGGRGYILLMDPDGEVPALGVDGTVGNHDNFEFGVLSIRQFDPERFGGISAVTELFNVRAADPEYLPMVDTDIAGAVNAGQKIIISMSSAKGDAGNPLVPDLTTELLPAVEIARVVPSGAGSAVDITGDMSDLNQFGTPDREAFIRVIAAFDYDDPAQAALGPFASLGEVTTTFKFN